MDCDFDIYYGCLLDEIYGYDDVLLNTLDLDISSEDSDEEYEDLYDWLHDYELPKDLLVKYNPEWKDYVLSVGHVGETKYLFIALVDDIDRWNFAIDGGSWADDLPKLTEFATKFTTEEHEKHQKKVFEIAKLFEPEITIERIGFFGLSSMS
jgi:hypothetical protein